jgi:glycosyltransferase involved in cell wall biosynthesis
MASSAPTEGPLVSVLLPVRNAQRTLLPALHSLQRQTYRNWECVLVDDGSADDSLSIARALARREPRLRLFERPAQGLPAALQFGLEQCGGHFIARMDADDLMHRTRLARQVALLSESPDLAVVGSHVRLFPRARLANGYRAYEQWLNSLASPEDLARNAFIECPLAHPTLMARAAVLRRFGYRPCPWPEDYDLLLRLLATGERVGVVAARLHLWRLHPQQTRRCHPRYRQSAIVRCKAHFLARGFLRGSSQYLLWGYGKTGRALQRALRNYGKEPAAIVEIHPRRLGQRTRSCPFVAPQFLATRPPVPLLVCVAGAEARQQIRGFLSDLAFHEGEDFLFAA